MKTVYFFLTWAMLSMFSYASTSALEFHMLSGEFVI